MAHRAWLIGGIATVLVACATEPPPAFDLKSCPAGWSGFAIECGDVRVPENHAAPDGRSITLNVAVLRAADTNDGREAQFELDGGPGLAVSDTVAFYATDGAMYRRTRDVVFVDMRGTGGSNPLRCPEIEEYEANEPWGAMYPVDLVARCALRLSANSDLSQYTTSNAVRDLEIVRAALAMPARSTQLHKGRSGSSPTASISPSPVRKACRTSHSTTRAQRHAPRRSAIIVCAGKAPHARPGPSRPACRRLRVVPCKRRSCSFPENTTR